MDGFMPGARFHGKRVSYMLPMLLVCCLAGCSGEGEKPAASPVAGASAGTRQVRPDDDVLSVLGVKTPRMAGEKPRAADENPASGLRIEVHTPKFDEQKRQPDVAPPPKRTSPLDH